MCMPAPPWLVFTQCSGVSVSCCLSVVRLVLELTTEVYSYSSVISMEKPESGNHCRKPTVFRRVRNLSKVTCDCLSVSNDK